NWWLRRSRKRKDSLELLKYLLLEISKLSAPFIPFTAEDIFMRLQKGDQTGTESVHLSDWPSADKKLIDDGLEKQMEEVRGLIAEGLAIRKANQLKVRQPLRSSVLGLSNEFSSDLENLIREELNIKDIIYDKSQKEKIILDLKLDQSLIFEGYAKELMRQIQDMRKEAGYRMDDEVSCQWYSESPELSSAINKWSKEIKTEVSLKTFDNSPHDNKIYNVEKEFELTVNGKVWLGIKK
ncbi:MAG: hypothetical protein COV30_00930, partial [Candidatus Yanofskybacteria bacterium CG10_big_fil_rev_8_21_14_0_10_37_15]